MLRAKYSQQLPWLFFVIWFVALASRFTTQAVLAEESGSPLSPSTNTAHEPQSKAATAASPSDARTAIDLAIRLERQQKYEEAIEQYQKALEISPQSVEAGNRLAWLLATCPVDRLCNGKKAIENALRVCEITQWKHPSAIDTLSVALAEDGQFRRAIELLTEFRAKVPASERGTFDHRLALFRAGKTYRQAKSAPASPPASGRRAEGKVDPELQNSFQEAVALEKAGRLREAAVRYEKAVDRAGELLGKDHVITARLMVRQGDMYLYTGHFDQALPLFKDALPVLLSHFPREHPAVTYCVNELGAVYNKKHNFDEALRLNRENLAVRETSLGKNHLHTLTSLQNVASACMGLHDHEEAVRLLNDWLERNERGQGDKHPKLPQVLNMLGTSYRNVDNRSEAEKCLVRALTVFKAQANTDRLLEAETMGELAMVLAEARKSKLDEALRYATRDLEITTEICGKDHLKTVSAKAVLAVVYQCSREFSQAEPLLREVLQGLENALGKDSPEVACYRIELARACLETGRPDKAEDTCAQCLDFIQEQLGPKNYFLGVEYAIPLSAEIAGRTRHQAQAEARLRQMVDILEDRLGKEEPLFARVLMQMGEA